MGEMMEKVLLMKKACEHILNDEKDKAIDLINENYKFEKNSVEKRKCSDKDKLRILFRDGFIDRYSGEKLLNPGILRVFSKYYPEDFPYHPNWKMDETHIAYWELSPTIDHVDPIAAGGEDNDKNWVSTSMLNNQAKSNYDIRQLGWKIYEPGNICDWDGLTKLFIEMVDSDEELKKDSYINRWYRLSKKMFEVGLL